MPRTKSAAQSRAGQAHRPRAIARRAERPQADAAQTGPVLVPLAAVALRLMTEIDSPGVIYLAADERRAEDLGRILARLAPAIETLVLPPWDCLPFDRASPSRESTGRRAAVAQKLAAAADRPRIVVTTIEAAFQKLPPLSALRDVHFDVTAGSPLDQDSLRAFAERSGYRAHERVTEPGDIEFHGQVVEVYPADAEFPYRIDCPEGVVTEISTFDPTTQRSLDAVSAVVLGPASEVAMVSDGEPIDRTGIEHRLPEFYAEPLQSVFDAMPEATLFAAPETGARREAFFEQLAEAREARAAFGQEPGATRLPASADALYLTEAEWDAVIARHEERDIVSTAFAPAPNFADGPKPVHAFQAYLTDALADGMRVVLAVVARDLKAFARFLAKHGGAEPSPIADWPAAEAAAPGSFLSLELDLHEGVVETEARLALITAGDVLGTRAHREVMRSAGREALLAEPPMRIGDTVIHEDHGIGILRGLKEVDIRGEPQEAVRIEYHGGDSLLAPVQDLGRLWRYGSDEEVVSLDRLHTDAWAKRRIEIDKAVRETAEDLVRLAAERAALSAPKLVPPRKAYDRFAARFAFAETADQARAIAAVLADLESGHPMDRLVCGDVGFGKTEVALRAAAAAALAGKQVAVVAPTTVLARQHLHTFRKRFAPFGIEIAGLSRLVDTAEAKRVKAGLADGTIRIVVGTQAVAGKDVAFADLGLLVIDEEQKFGAKLKADLRALAEGMHVLTLTATPIPRTLQMAMAGIQAVSVIATPPVRRRPIRTFVAPFDAASVRTALLRERARGGQSFVVVPRVEEIDAMRERLGELVPELSIAITHGGLPAEEADRAMVAFAGGSGDVLLATNIIESGLDVPRANTMLVWHPDRFGLSQLHQLRGRVGRGRAQGVTYLLTDPDTTLTEAATARLAALASADRLGAGLALSIRDLDIRGAGDLVGEQQAGHLKLIGLGLYQSLLGRAVRLAKHEIVDDDAPPEIHIEMMGRIPAAYVAEPDLRIEIYARLSRLEETKAISNLEAEVEDRFGALPEEVETLFALTRLRTLARRIGIASLNAGPRAIALVLRPWAAERLQEWLREQIDLVVKGPKLVLEQETVAGDGRRAAVEALLARLDAAGAPTMREAA